MDRASSPPDWTMISPRDPSSRTLWLYFSSFCVVSKWHWEPFFKRKATEIFNPGTAFVPLALNYPILKSQPQNCILESPVRCYKSPVYSTQPCSQFPSYTSRAPEFWIQQPSANTPFSLSLPPSPKLAEPSLKTSSPSQKDSHTPQHPCHWQPRLHHLPAISTAEERSLICTWSTMRWWKQLQLFTLRC